MKRIMWLVFFLTPGLEFHLPAVGADTEGVEASSASRLEWLDDYHAAYQRAEASNRSLLIWYVDPAAPEIERSLSSTWRDAQVREKLQRYVPLRVTTTAAFDFDGQRTVLLKHSSFTEMLGRPGVAIVDLADAESRYFRQVVSVYPLARNETISPREMAVLLDLPNGSLTQRTLILAVRTHHESPQSTSGQLLPLLATEAESHSHHQASIMLQGHHNWDQRFYRINDQLPNRMIATEVCAESWPGQKLLEAARDCVHSWRQSSGHWDAVRRGHRAFGYDMKRGNNGIWYATGIFGDAR